MNIFTRPTFRLTQWLLLLTVALLPFEHLPTGEFAGFTIKLSYIAAILCLLSCVIWLPKTDIRTYRPDSAEYSLIGLLIVAFTTSFTIAPDKNRAIIFSLLWLFVFLMYALTKRLFVNQEMRRVATLIVLAVTALICLFGIYQYIGDSLGLPASATGLRTQYTKIVFGFPRISSVALEPLYFSNYLLVPFFLCLQRLVSSPRPTKYVWLLGLIALNIILGISRGAYLALICGLVVFFMIVALAKIKIEPKRLMGVLVALVAALLLAAGGIRILNGTRASSNFVNHAAVSDGHKEASVNERFTTFKLAEKLFESRPWFGHGPSSFGIITGGYSKQKPVNGYGIVNNEYLELLAEVGAVGTLFFLVFLSITATKAVKALRNSKVSALECAALLAGCVAIFVQYNFFSTLYILYIWVFLGWLSSFSAPESTRSIRTIGQ